MREGNQVNSLFWYWTFVYILNSITSTTTPIWLCSDVCKAIWTLTCNELFFWQRILALKWSTECIGFAITFILIRKLRFFFHSVFSYHCTSNSLNVRSTSLWKCSSQLFMCSTGCSCSRNFNGRWCIVDGPNEVLSCNRKNCVYLVIVQIFPYIYQCFQLCFFFF